MEKSRISYWLLLSAFALLLLFCLRFLAVLVGGGANQEPSITRRACRPVEGGSICSENRVPAILPGNSRRESCEDHLGVSVQQSSELSLISRLRTSCLKFTSFAEIPLIWLFPVDLCVCLLLSGSTSAWSSRIETVSHFYPSREAVGWGGGGVAPTEPSLSNQEPSCQSRAFTLLLPSELHMIK